MNKTYEMVTQSILERLDHGVIPWRQSWITGLPCSLGSKKEYRGINVLLLGSHDHTSKYWVTYREAEKLGGFVKKGSKGSPIVFWHWRSKEEQEKLIREGKAISPAPCTPFLYRVFNLEQTEGLTKPESDLGVERKERILSAESLVYEMKDRPSVSHSLSRMPCYIPSADTIQMPHLSQFESANQYYATLFHELVHSTGHEKRLNREQKGASSADWDLYSYEELVAEVGAAILCAVSGVENVRTIEDQAAYIAHWKKFIVKDGGAFMRACSDAQKAVDLIRGCTFQTEQ